MSNNTVQTIFLVCAGLIALVFVKLMFDMSQSMSEMTAHISTMSRDVSQMREDIHVMNQSMMRMDENIRGLGQAFSRGSEQFQQMNPAGMMQQVFPDRGQPGR